MAPGRRGDDPDEDHRRERAGNGRSQWVFWAITSLVGLVISGAVWAHHDLRTEVYQHAGETRGVTRGLWDAQRDVQDHEMRMEAIEGRLAAIEAGARAENEEATRFRRAAAKALGFKF